jgi:hypothetical protein
VLLAYVDESGNTGLVSKGGSLTYALGCVLIDADDWPIAFDGLLAFRRRIKQKVGIHLRSEIKAQYLLRNSGDLRRYALGPGARQMVYRAHMSTLTQLPARAFAVVVDKRNQIMTPDGYFDLAWETLLQRLSRTSQEEQCTFAVLHDEGEDDAIRRWVRQSRRYLTAGSLFGTGSLNIRATRLVDDPVPRKSSQSYFIQLADLVAYAAFRSVVPPGAAVALVCPQDMWDEIGSATHTAVNKYRPRAAPGIVLR